jgi:mannose-6-phosphate isomerase-like protein (cupin superfamily)
MTSTAPESAEAVWIGSFGTIYRVPGDATPSGVAVVEHVLGPRRLGAPLHRHSREDEISHVLAGELSVQQGDQVATVAAGGTVVKPRGVFHAFWNPGSVPVRFLEVIAPGAFAGYFRELAPLLGRPGPPDLAAIGALAARYGVEFDFPSLPRLLERYGLEVG